jgi:hypothetical protein
MADTLTTGSLHVRLDGDTLMGVYVGEEINEENEFEIIWFEPEQQYMLDAINKFFGRDFKRSDFPGR